MFSETRNVEKRIIDLPMLSDDEYNKVVHNFNDTAVDYPRDKCVHELFEEQVQRTPGKTAVIACDKTLTYREMNEQANRIANGLIENGVKPGDIVALMLPRRSFLIAAMFGVLKAGAAYMPIDPDYPQDRIDYILNDSGAKFCVTEDNINELLSNDNIPSPQKKTLNGNKYCILPTSGSTGMPKLLALTHRGLINFMYANSAFWKNVEKVVATTIVTFDACIMDTILSVCMGKTVIFASENQIYTQSEYESLFTYSDKNMLFSTPTKISSYIKNSKTNFLAKIKTLIVGGEIFNDELYKSLRKYTDAIIYNGYGPAETTIGVSFAEMKEVTVSVSNSTPREFLKPTLIEDLSVLSQAEREKILFDFNDTAVDYPKEKTVHQLFEEQVERTPDKTAVIACDKTLTYQELNEQANRIAHGLIENGVKPGDIVALMLPRRSYLIATMFGILKSGAAYMPIDPDYPQDRIEYMLADSNAAFCVTKDTILELHSNPDMTNPQIEMSSESVFCCIYTSGSTGKPKGCVLLHRGINNFCINNNVMNYALQSKISLVGASVNNVIFDFFISENISLFGNVKKCAVEKDPKNETAYF